MDAASWRNVLLTDARLLSPLQRNDAENLGSRMDYGEVLIPLDLVTSLLGRLGLPMMRRLQR